MRTLTLSDLKLGIGDLLSRRVETVRATRCGAIYEPLLRASLDAIHALPAATFGSRPLSDQLSETDVVHDGFGNAVWYLTEAYLRLPTATKKQRAAASPPKKRTKAADLPLPFPRHPSRPAAPPSQSVVVSHLLPDEDEYSEYREKRRTQRRAARTDKYGAPFYQRWTPGPGADLPTEHRRELRVHFADVPGFSQFWSFADLCRHSVGRMREWPLCTRFGAELVFYYRRARFTKTQRKGEFQARWCPDSDVAGYRAFMAERPYRRF